MTKPEMVMHSVINTRRKIYQTALEKWGADAQALMVFEEMAELQKELCKNARGKDNHGSIAEEIADVQVMLEQMIALTHPPRKALLD